MLSKIEAARIADNLFHQVRDIVKEEPDFPWHRDGHGGITADRTHSSQALALDVFGTVDRLCSKPGILESWQETLELHMTGPWSLTLEYLVPKSLLREPRQTQVDVLAESADGVVCFECKFKESDGGGCSQPSRIPKGTNKGLCQCNGNYERQVNPTNGIKARCALTGKGIRYWEIIPEIFGLDADADYRPCPFRAGWYQWMRNLVAAHQLAAERRCKPAFILVYADGDFPMANKVKTKYWRELTEAVATGSVPIRAISYQKLISLALAACGKKEKKILQDLAR